MNKHKLTINQPQSSCPFKNALQKIYGLGYNLLVFVYDKRDDQETKTAILNFVNCSFLEKDRTGDYTITYRLREMIKDGADEEVSELKNVVEAKLSFVSEPDRREYGDFQTNNKLADKVVKYILKKEIKADFDFVSEPTCGKGNFILSCLENIPAVKKITGVEIYLPYVWEAKFKILNYFILNRNQDIPVTEIIHANIFNFDFSAIAEQTKGSKTLIIGKPEFSIFGVGDYSFALYKVAVSGLYKRTLFTLVLPDDDKPVMLDDTCYFINLF